MRAEPAVSTDPLADLLHAAAREAEDPAVRHWLRHLLEQGESAGSEEALALVETKDRPARA